jgi:diguanylate cyclase (GGDEF)-like protein
MQQMTDPKQSIAARAVEFLKLPSVAFGLITLGLIWWGVFLLIEIEAAAARRSIANDTANLSLVFEQNVIRSFNEIDKSILYLRHAHEKAPAKEMWPSHIQQVYASTDMTFQLAVIDANGRLIATDRGPQPPLPIDLSDRDHFRVHAHMPGDTIYISKPVLGRFSKKWSLQLTRRLSKPDGTFDGVIVASIDPDHFSQSFGAINLGAGGSVTLVGLDGIVRASGGVQPATLGARIEDARIVEAVRQERKSTNVYHDTRTGTPRISSARWVHGYPLAVVVATNELQPDGSSERNSRIYCAAATLMSLLLLLALAAIMRRSARLAETRRALKAKSQQHAVTLENISQGILMVDRDGVIGFMNSRLIELLGLPDAFANASLSYRELVGHMESKGEFRPPIDADLLEFIRSPDTTSLIAQYERERPDGTVLLVRTKAIPGGGFVRTISDITGRRRAERTVLQLARNDTLTSLANRAAFRHQLEQATADIANTPSFALHMIDLDRFKPVNDTYGHAMGDLLLKAVADRLRASVRGNDLVGRLGGDEFAIIQRDVASEPQSAALAKRICRALGEPFTIDGHVITIGASVGIARAPMQGETAQDLLNAADLALYSAKAAARGTYAFYNEELHQEQCARRALEHDLRQAIEDEAFELHYQPIVSIETGEITAYEALLRWRHPERGNVPPLDFIPLAEETGLIRAIGAWVLRTACSDIGRRAGAARIAINLSPVQFRDQGLVDTIKSALDESGLAANRLEIEITESTLLQNDALTLQHLDALRALGVHITMDDFGTGYSALSYLMSYPIQTIKIDRSFVNGLGQQACSSAIVKTISTLASNLGMSTTAEGVETPEQLAMLREIGCTEAQGYYFSRPKPAAEILPPIKPVRTTLRVAS